MEQVYFKPKHDSTSEGYRRCATTVMDTCDPEITFDEKGDSQYVKYYRKKTEKELFKGEKGKALFLEWVEKVKNKNQKKEFDCICGISGGVDSCTVLYHAVDAGLRPLVIHIDNGWNDEKAVGNIEKITGKLKVPFHTVVLEWESFSEIQRCLFLASVPNVEMATDHAIVANLFREASRFGIQEILSGSNLATEAFLQSNSGHDNKDWYHIKEIVNCFSKRKKINYSHLTFYDFSIAIFFKKIRFVPILNWLDYQRDQQKTILHKRFGWQDYGRKHGESTFTKFFQEIYLPQKYGIDKRKAHFSCCILSDQMSRETALNLLEKPLHSPQEENNLSEYVRKKLKFSGDDWAKVNADVPKPHKFYKTHPAFRSTESPVYQAARYLATSRSLLKAIEGRITFHHAKTAFYIYSAAGLGFFFSLFRDVLFVKTTNLSQEVFQILYFASFSSLASINAITFSKHPLTFKTLIHYLLIGLFCCLVLSIWKSESPSDVLLALFITAVWIIGSILSKSLLFKNQIFLARVRDAFSSIFVSGFLIFGLFGKAALFFGFSAGYLFYWMVQKKYGQKYFSQAKKMLIFQNQQIDLFNLILITFPTYIALFWAMQMNSLNEIILGFRLGDMARFSMYIFQIITVGSIGLIPLFSRLSTRGWKKKYFLVPLLLVCSAFYFQNLAGLFIVPILGAFTHIFIIYFTISKRDKIEAKENL